ncbi:hypothetical protein [Streptomyces griseoluteus]|uniref:hypothetical protein n=1 Tax=Streptomyces griseoluteus TaxID=29306 RepID=UPI0036B4B83D
MRGRIDSYLPPPSDDQSSGTVARFYHENGTERWSSRAPQSGTPSWTPVWHIRPC